ncbi:hypothetical protein [Bacillus velezensis]|uniref:hypothetical protein n=1 Tax=Bacillus velezensis TaxID=492670 RepID=UPI000A719E44|nr:hypothetical protein [Bacillus velezensis]WHM01665.1 hypothetical protein QLX50_16920 [Bacillus velezensis]
MISAETLRKSFFDVTATRLAEAGMSERISADSVSAAPLCIAVLANPKQKNFPVVEEAE